MILFYPLFCAINILISFFNQNHILNYLTILEGIFLFVLSLNLSAKNILFPMKNEVLIKNSDITIIRIYLVISSLIFIIFSPLYIFNIIPNSTSIIILCAIPTLFSGLAINKIRKTANKK